MPEPEPAIAEPALDTSVDVQASESPQNTRFQATWQLLESQRTPAEGGTSRAVDNLGKFARIYSSSIRATDILGRGQSRSSDERGVLPSDRSSECHLSGERVCHGEWHQTEDRERV